MTSSVISLVQRQKRVAELVPSLSPSQAEVLGLISYGIVMFDGCGMTRLSNALGKVEQVKASPAARDLLRGSSQAGKKAARSGCAGLLRRTAQRDLVGMGREEGAGLALSLDASTLGERFTVLNLSVVYRGLLFQSPG